MLLARALFGDGSCFGEVIDDRFHVVVGDVFGAWQRNGQSFPMEDVVLGAPFDGVRILNVLGGFDPPDAAPTGDPPMWLPKVCNFVSGDGGRIPVPAVLAGPVQIESELAVVVGRRLCKASPAEARGAIFGWSVLNDVTAPELGGVGIPHAFWAVAKSLDGFASWGPWIRRDLTEERVLDGLAITSSINGTRAQSGNTKHFRFAPSEVLSHISHRITLFPGDVLALGTPVPPPEVVVGDHVVCEVEEVGALHNHFVADATEPSSPTR